MMKNGITHLHYNEIQVSTDGRIWHDLPIISAMLDIRADQLAENSPSFAKWSISCESSPSDATFKILENFITVNKNDLYIKCWPEGKYPAAVKGKVLIEKLCFSWVDGVTTVSIRLLGDSVLESCSLQRIDMTS